MKTYESNDKDKESFAMARRAAYDYAEENAPPETEHLAVRNKIFTNLRQSPPEKAHLKQRYGEIPL